MNALAGKVIVVTGAGRGIGRHIALLAGVEGACVVVNDLGGSVEGEGADAAPAAAVAAEIVAAGGTAVANTDSVSEPEGAWAIVATAVDAFGRIDGVVNNAGIVRDRIFHKMTVEDFEQVVRVHLFGTFYVSRAAAEHFRRQEGGVFVHMTSTSGLIGNFGQANYAAAKLGIAALSKSIALDMARFGVRSNAVAPFAWSRLVGTIPDSEAEPARMERMKRMGAEKVAPLVVYLLSDLAASVNGQIIGARANEIFLFTQSRPARSIHRSDGWTVETLDAHLVQTFGESFAPLERSPDVFGWDPI